jgi:hypothetical protein
MEISDSEVRTAIANLADVVRAENIQSTGYLDLYVGHDALDSLNNVNNQVVYGRRGSGKTHLLKALQERINGEFAESRRIAVYIDSRKILPHSEANSLTPEQIALVVFRNIIQKLIDAFSENVRPIFGRADVISIRTDPLDEDAKENLNRILKIINLELQGKSIRRLAEVPVTREEISKTNKRLTLSSNPEAAYDKEDELRNQTTVNETSFISIFDVAENLEKLVEWLDLNRVICLVDEWSEVPVSAQRHLAEMIKKAFIASKFSFKIAAIPNRTDLGIKTGEKFYGLEDGGDIFGYQLDNRYVFEIDKVKTRHFFNQLLHKHIGATTPELTSKLLGKKRNESFINLFLTNKALGELLIASAGIPRDFINLFIHSYEQFKDSNAKHISVKNIRIATSGWYETDKKKQVDDHPIEKALLQAIVQEIVVNKNSSHFMIGEQYSTNPHIQSLIDFRVLHLRKKGYSHKDLAKETFNVYSIDYGCYNHLNITRTNLDNDFLSNMAVHEDIRDIRRIYLNDLFMQKFQLNIGEAFYCPICKKAVDINHPAYVKQKVCNHCFEKIEAK